ncbi:bromodomain adjacent to zinc finger domain protein 2A isoform X2 [Paramormyrops kingsleyae]|uniref:Bromodomain adjacent to zinc finger domain, 2A n=1 Tax=Paramormyrops kingsleyae TaxID=1676925 RepID=A0A3B3QSV8_9TELE|nr:bromodomain adjacent to zinc finger domain protein 2A isoform X2 [Paramormyrops kingsleyae]
MEANNLFNFGGHPSETANSGLKLPSGDTLYTNGSSMSFPQPGKNMNGEMNVNGITTVIGTSTSGPHPSTAYSLMSNHHHQSGLGYDYLWSEPSYGQATAMNSGHGPSMHHKQGSSGVMQQQQQQQQQQQHFQGHGQYQLNGELGGSHASAVAAPPNVTLSGGSYWGRESPIPQQSGSSMTMSYGSGNTYSSYQNQVHPSVTPPQHHHQHQHHQQQQQHFGMMPNGVPYYQPQAPHPPLPSGPAQARPPMILPNAQNFTPPRNSPQHQHHLGRGASGSPLPLAPISVPGIPSALPDNGASQTCDTGVLPTVMQGHVNETYKDVGSGYNGVEQTPTAQRLAEPEAFASKPPAPSTVPPNDYCPQVQHIPPDVGPPMNQKHELGVRMKDAASLVVLAPTVALVETGPPEPGQIGFPVKTGLDTTVEPEAATPHARTKTLDGTESDVRMVAHSDAELEKPPTDSCPRDEASERTSSNVRLLEERPSAGELLDVALNDTCKTKESTDCSYFLESSCMDSSGPVDTSALESTYTDSSHLDDTSHHEEETLDNSLAYEETSLNDTSQLGESQSDTSQNSTASVSMSAPSNDSKMEDDQDVPDSAGSGTTSALGDRYPEGCVSQARSQFPGDSISFLPPVTSTVARNTGKLAGKGSAARGPQPPQLSPSAGEWGRKATAEQKGGAKAEAIKPEIRTEFPEHAAKLLPSSFKKAVGSELFPSQLQSPATAKPKKAKRVKKLAIKVPKTPKVKLVVENKGNDDVEDEERTAASGDGQRRRVATEEQVNFPLLHGWRREIRVRKSENRLKGETWYYSPCGKRMKQFPEVIKFLKRHQDSVVSREHFSFSPRIPVGDFYEERETAEGMKWFFLADEEVPSMIMAITGRRGRPPNPDKERPRSRRTGGGASRRPGRPPKTKMVDLLSKVEAKLLKKLEAQETLSEEDKEKLNKIKRKMKRKARNKKREDAKIKKDRQEKRKAKLEKSKEEQESLGEAQGPRQPVQEPKKPGRRKRAPIQEKVVEEKENAVVVKRAGGARSKAKALAKAQAEAEAQAQAAAAARRQAERRAQAQRRQEERKRQQLILEELKKPTEDMCLTDHQMLPEFSRIPGVMLSGQAFSHCLMVVEFLHSYGKVLGLQVPRDVPSLAVLQEGLLGLGDSQGEVQELLVKLVQTALCDPGLPPHYQSVKILGEKLVDLELNRSSVSEVLRVFLDSHTFQPDVCKSLRTKPFQALSPDVKASILAFLVDELNASGIIIREIDNTLENMATYRKNKWTIEGKLRKLKSALARRTGRSADELHFEERRRSARVAEEENLYLEENGFSERSSRRARKEEAQLSEAESPTSASVPELERQIDKLTKRQIFFRKKLLQASHSLRAVSLGQDRYRRRYWVMPHVGGILVEGAEEILASQDVLVKEEPEPLLSPVKVEPKAEPPLSPVADPSSASHHSSPEVDPLPGTASLMSSPRGRGRPRKIKPEVELHLRTAKSRRRRRSSRAGSDDQEGGAIERGMQDLTQSAFLSWLSQTQGSLPDPGAGPEVQPVDSVKEMAEKQGQWFNLLPKTPCDNSSLSQPPALPSSPSKDPLPFPEMPPSLTAPLLQPVLPLSSPAPSTQVCSNLVPKPGRRRRRASGSLGMGFTSPAKRRGRPPSKLLQEIEQKYFTQLVARPIPTAKVRGWWLIRDPEEVKALLPALHCRGIREKALHKHLSKHMEFLSEVCSRPSSDPMFQLQVEEGSSLLQVLQKPWQESQKSMEADLSVLQWVEDLEQRVFTADLQIKGLNVPEPDSSRADLEYYEHDVELLDDWIVRTKKEWSDLLRLPTHPLDLAVVRLLRLERNIERRYLKEPLWTLAEVVRLAPLTPPPGGENHMDAESLESEITPRVRAWRQAVDRCRSAAQLCLCLLQLERAIAWERSVNKVTCLVCRKGDNDEYLLLCDGCERGCHMYCLRPKVTQVPEGDWFCPICISEENGDSPRLRRFPKPKSRARKRHVGDYGSESSDDDEGYRKGGGGMSTRRREGTPASYTRFSGESGGSNSFPSKRRRMATRNQPDLTYCEIILMEMEAHTDAWPFLEPVNPRLVPGYRRIIKNPMDFLTMRERLLKGGYCSCEEFAADAELVFNNCQLFNEDTSEVGKAGHSMRRFFESRWAEFYQNKDK